MTVSEAVRRARWVEAEVVHLKRVGLSFEAIADHITAVGLRKATPMIAISAGVNFSPDYRISKQACHKSFSKAIAREPALGVEELRKIDHERSEEMWMNLQPAIRRGNPRAMEVGVKVLEHAAKINGYAAPRPRNERTLPDDSDERIPIALVRKIIDGEDVIGPASPPRHLLKKVAVDSPSTNGSPAGGVAPPNSDNAAPENDLPEFSAVIEWSVIEEVRDMLEEEEKMKMFLRFI